MTVQKNIFAPKIVVGLPRSSRILRIGLCGVASTKAAVFEVLLLFTRKW